MSELAVSTDEFEQRKQERARHLALSDIPRLRLLGFSLISIGVFLNNRYILGQPDFFERWLFLTIVGFAYCTISWLFLRLLYDRVLPRDLSFLFLTVDVLVFTLAVYLSGAENSWLFFILMARAADQAHTTFRRCVGFVVFAAACYAGMEAWVVLVDHRPIAPAQFVARIVFILGLGIYVALTARTVERRRAHLRDAMRVSRDLIARLEDQSDQLRDARSRAEEASAAKSEFLANMSHEMRTPLHGVIGMLQLAIDGEESPRRMRQLDLARRSAESLLATIDDLLDFSRIEARKIDLEPVYFSLREVMTETMKPLGVTAAARDMILAVGIAPDVPDTVWGDPVRLRQVLINLVGNAIKFTNEGEISVRVNRDDTQLRFEVRDTGIGIPEELRTQIFKPFAQGDSSNSRKFGGTGLGLAIVARLVEAMGGRIDLTSEPGKGSSFSIVLGFPADGVGAAPPRAKWEDGLRGRRVVVVEPNATSRQFIVEILASREMEVVACASVVDVPPGRFACAITADESLRVEPAIFIESALGHISDDNIRLSRPVAERELIDAIGTSIGLTRRASVAAPLEKPRKQGGLRILVAEDNLVNQEFAGEALRRLGHNVALASDGQEALAMLRREIFDIVLMDVQMPVLDGLEVTRQYRKGESEGVRTPIVALTAHTRSEDRERCLEAGMDAVLTKPIDLRQLETVLRTMTGVEPIVDAVGGNLKLLAKVSDAFAKQTPGLIASMRKAIEESDSNVLFEGAHKMKGAVSNFEGDPSYHLSLMLEAAARQNDFVRARSVLLQLEAAVAALERRISTVMADV